MKPLCCGFISIIYLNPVQYIILGILQIEVSCTQIMPLGKLVRMKQRKTLIDVAAVTLALLIFILWHQNSMHRAQTTFHNVSNYDVYLITTDRGLEFWEILNQGAADMAALIGVNYRWEAPEKRDTRQQIDLINKAVENGANALIIAADDPKLISRPVEDAKAQGVKIIYVDTPAYEEAITTLATDNYEAGVMAGKTMLTVLNDMDIQSGAIGIVNLAKKANTALRETGFRDTIAKDLRYHILDTVYTVNDLPEVTQEAAQSLIEQNSDLVALFGTSEGTSIGVGRAIGANGNRYVGIGFDKTEIMSRLLRNGSLKAIIDQNPYTMGYLGMAQAVAAVLGKDTGPEYIDTGVSVVYGR